MEYVFCSPEICGLFVSLNSAHACVRECVWMKECVYICIYIYMHREREREREREDVQTHTIALVMHANMHAMSSSSMHV